MGQNPTKITVKKDPGYIYFFQKGSKSDTITADKHHLFYLLVPDSLKEEVVVNSDNGQLLKTKNDSIVLFKYIPGLRYELAYEIKPTQEFNGEYGKNQSRLLQTKNGSYKTLINGISNLAPGNIKIQLFNKRQRQVLSEQIFYFIN